MAVTKKSSFESLGRHLDLIDEGVVETQNSVSDSDFSASRSDKVASKISSPKPGYMPSIFARTM